jgi:hypothetical protein
MKSDGKLWKSDANDASTMPIVAIATAIISADAAGIVMIHGFIRDDSYGWTPGAEIYASGTAGGYTQTAPSASGDQVQRVGIATHADRFLFNPSPDVIEI